MGVPNLKLVEDMTDAEIEEARAEIDSKSADKALEKVRKIKTGDVLPPDEPGEFVFNDLGNARRFLNIFGEDLLYLEAAKKWLIWEENHWGTDNTNFVYDMAFEYVDTLFSAENLASNSKAFAFAKSSNDVPRIDRMLKVVQRMRTAPVESFDEQPYLLNCRNGTLDLQTGELRAARREDRITRSVNCDYIPDLTSRTFESFLETIQPDPDIRAFLQRSIGYSLLGNVRERSFWILYGTGNNGKSIFINLFKNLLGEYASATTTSSVMATKQSSIPNDIARLKGKRFIIIPETEENERLNAALIKALSAGDMVTARFLFGEYFNFYFSGKLWIATNHKPTITDHSKGFWDRLKLIPFTQDIPPNKVIKSDLLMSQLLADASAILNWAVLGCRDYFDLDGLSVPKVIQDEIDAYRFEQDSIAQFVADRFETMKAFQEEFPDVYIDEERFKAKNPEVYTEYKKFCEVNGENARSQRRLSQNLAERGFTQQPENGVRTWKGFRLNKIEV